MLHDKKEIIIGQISLTFSQTLSSFLGYASTYFSKLQNFNVTDFFFIRKQHRIYQSLKILSTLIIDNNVKLFECEKFIFFDLILLCVISSYKFYIIM